MKHSMLIGLLCYLLMVQPVMACNPTFFRHSCPAPVTAVSRTVLVTPAIPVQSVSQIYIAQFSPAYYTLPTYSVGQVAPGVVYGGGQSGVPLSGYGGGAVIGGSPIAPAGTPIPPGASPGAAPQPPGGLSGGVGDGQGRNPGQPDVAALQAELDRLRAELSILKAGSGGGKEELPPATPEPGKAKPGPGPTEKPEAKEPAKQGWNHGARAHQPLAGLGKCTACHAGQNAEGSLDLSAGLERLTASQLARTVARASNASMPPRKDQRNHPPMTPAEVAELKGRAEVVQQTARR